MDKKNYENFLKTYIEFLKKNKNFIKKDINKYEFNIEKLNNWTGSNFTKNLKWFNDQKKGCKAIISFKHLKNLEKWKYDDKRGKIYHSSGGFFSIIGVSTKNASREVDAWDQPFVRQAKLVGGVIGLVRKKIKKKPGGVVPHYLVEAKFEPGNYNLIQLSPSVQATYSNLNQVHKGIRNKVINAYFKTEFRSIKKTWVSEDGGRLFKKRNMHWIIETNKPIINLPKNYRWMTIWEINEFINNGTFVGPHLRSILSLI